MGSHTLRPTFSTGATGGSAQVRQAIARASSRTGVDFGYLMNQARVESSLDPSAKARTSSATGLFQFIDQTWLGTVEKHGAKHGMAWAADAITRRADGRYVVNDPQARQAILSMRYDADASSAMAAEFASDNADHLRARLGREPNSTDLYFAHFLGAGGAAKFLSAAARSPESSAAAGFPKAAAANRSIFYDKAGAPRSYAQVYALMGRKLGTDTMAPGSLSAGDGFAMPQAPALPDNPAERLSPTAPTFDTLPFAPDGEEPVTTLAALEQQQSSMRDMLRPSPHNARLAYLMVVSSLGRA